MDVEFTLNGIGFVANKAKKAGNPKKHQGVTFEQAAEAPRSAMLSVPSPMPPSVSRLVERHESLRETVAQALGELDKLLAELEQ